MKNVECLRKHARGLPVFPVIKANAYGHGAALIAQLCEEKVSAETMPYFVVARCSEAAALRSAGIQRPLIVLNSLCCQGAHVWPEESTLVIHDAYDVKHIADSRKTRYASLKEVHLSLDSGMNRLGIRPEESLEKLHRLAEDCVALGLQVTGLMSHFARAEENPALLSSLQEKRFVDWVGQLDSLWEKAWGSFPLWRHMANSAAALRGLATSAPIFTAIRPGLALWGVTAEAREGQQWGLEPVACVQAPIRQLFWLEAGEGLGYGHREIVARRTLVGTVELGYADGFRRDMSHATGQKPSVGGVWVADSWAPVLGTVSMDLIMVDLTDHPRRTQWDSTREALTAEWIGPRLSSEQIARSLGTIPYEVLCSMGARLPRRRVSSHGIEGAA